MVPSAHPPHTMSLWLVSTLMEPWPEKGMCSRQATVTASWIMTQDSELIHTWSLCWMTSSGSASSWKISVGACVSGENMYREHSSWDSIQTASSTFSSEGTIQTMDWAAMGHSNCPRQWGSTDTECASNAWIIRSLVDTHTWLRTKQRLSRRPGISSEANGAEGFLKATILDSAVIIQVTPRSSTVQESGEKDKDTRSNRAGCSIEISDAVEVEVVTPALPLGATALGIHS